MAYSDNILLTSLKSQKIMVPEKTNIVYKYLSHILKEQNIQLDIFYQGNTSGISNLLKKHNGILIQDYHHALAQLDDSLIIKEIEPKISYTYGWTYNDILSENELNFIAYAKKIH